VAQLVEHHLAKVGVAGSNPVVRSKRRVSLTGVLDISRPLASFMGWDEAFSSRYEEWSAHMTADVAFYVELARNANGPNVFIRAR
jgi:hypothetical protein